MRFATILCVALAAGCAAAAADTSTVTLTVGDLAPPLKAMAWVKGEPLKAFEKGKVYVVEFWSLDCSPCIEGLKHLSELTRQYPGQFTAVSVHSEGRLNREVNDKYLKRIRTFVEKRGEKMACLSAVDDPRQSPVYKDWMAASGHIGPGGTFIVDREGKIAWISPDSIDEPLLQVIDGKTDLEAAKAGHRQMLASAARISEMNDTDPVNRALAPAEAALRIRGGEKTAVAEAEKAMAANPQDAVLAASGSLLKLSALLSVNEQQGIAFARQLLKNAQFMEATQKEPRFPAGPWYWVGSKIVAVEGLSRGAYEFAIECFEQAERHPDVVKDALTRMTVLRELSHAYENLGDYDAAIREKQRSVDIAGQELATFPADVAPKTFVATLFDIYKDDVKRLESMREESKR